MGGHHLLNAAGFLVQNAHLGGVAVSYVADGGGHVRAQGVRLGQILAVKLLAHQVAQGLALQGGVELLAGPAGGLAGDQGLAGAGGIAGIRGDPGVAALIDDVVPV